MKHLTSIAFGIILLLSACSQETPLTVNQEKLVKIPAKIHIEEALKNAEILFSSIEGNTRSKNRTVKSIQTIGLDNETRSFETSSSAKYYLVNYENEEGFAVLSADRRLGTIFAIAEEGSLSLEDTVDNPGLANFFSGLKTMINHPALRDSTTIVVPTLPTDSAYQIAIDKFIPPKMPQTVQKWPRNKTYGLPDIYSPLVTSIAQIMATFAIPNKWIYYADSNKPMIELNWTLIQKYQISTNTTEGFAEVKELFDLIISDFCESDYGGSTSIQLGMYGLGSNWHESFMRRGYWLENNYSPATPGGFHRHEEPLKASYEEWRTALKDNKLPLACDLINGPTENPTDQNQDPESVCHFWVVDGYIKYLEPIHSIMKQKGIDTMFHCVWGKGGKANGYFIISNKMIPVKADRYINEEDPYPDSGERAIFYHLVGKDARYQGF